MNTIVFGHEVGKLAKAEHSAVHFVIALSMKDIIRYNYRNIII